MFGLRDPFTALLSLLLGLYLGTLLPKYPFDSSGIGIAYAIPSNITQAGTWLLTASDKAALIKAASFVSRKGRSIADSHEAAALYRSVEKRLAEAENAVARTAEGVPITLRSMRLHVRLALADAINSEARARTHSNTLIRRGTLDLDPAFRKASIDLFWKVMLVQLTYLSVTCWSS
jgi:type IV secretory pathway TrbL component